MMINTSSNNCSFEDLKEIKVTGQNQFLRELNHMKDLPKERRVCEMNKLQENEQTGERDDIFNRQFETEQMIAEHCSPKYFF